MTTRKRICLVCPSLNAGGIEKSMIRLCEQFCARSYPVDFLVCLPSSKPFYQPDARANLEQPDWERRPGRLNSIRFYARLMRWIRSRVRNNRPDLVIVYGDYFGPLVIFSLAFLGIPVFVSDRMSPDRRFLLAVRWAKRMSYPRAAGFIAQTERAARSARARYGASLPIRVIPNPVEAIAPPPKERQRTLLCVGRLNYEKGRDIAVQAFAEADPDDWQLKIAGEGPERPRLEALIEQLGLSQRVYLLGEISNVPDLMRECAIFILPSRSEGFPNALCEAMSAGMACISFAGLNDPDIIREDGLDGVLVKEQSVAALADAISAVTGRDELRVRMQTNAVEIQFRLESATIFERMLSFIRA
ncbi:MAG: glycosyltransferase [Wenzhouxiangella sp.]|nr:glycosyltransferase [Wenzhouxiangella sp.]